MPFNKLSATLVLAGLLVASCQNTGGNYEPPESGALEESAWIDKINLSTSVKTRIVVREVREARQHDLLRVQVDLQNLLSTQSSFRTSVEWFDIAGFKIDSPNDGWMSHIVQPQEKFTITAGAVNPDAVSWRLNVDTWNR